MMLSRVAERVYWLARYLERVENTARLINVHTNLLMDLPADVEVGWFTLVTIFDGELFFHASYDEINENNVMHFLLADENNAISLINSLSALRENARTSLDILPEETWEQVNELYLLVKSELSAISNRRRRQKLLLSMSERCQTVWGILANHMSRNHGYYFMQTAKHLERADMTSRILELASLLLAENRSQSMRAVEGILWSHLLRALSAQQMFTHSRNNDVNAEAVLAFLLRDSAFPRSLFFSLGAINRYLSPLPGAQKVIDHHRQSIEFMFENPQENLPAEEIHNRMDALQIRLAGLNTAIGQQWFYPVHSS
ncbi:hypothetical protein MPL1_11193 [Methylophaga lonarensis MPL]|uniref:DUF403 domain-containing protein n=1 Tax=Methylophaga lonarensis MPL TaxID=1286106 RepID=M7NYL3_9GAMM|nr:alpha-E domain-containing protein [Methylophaga lonarensis]EMR12276.1 hypothetical protein MPL1_11193 [Methylophaga lonarensis MPL]